MKGPNLGLFNIKSLLIAVLLIGYITAEAEKDFDFAGESLRDDEDFIADEAGSGEGSGDLDKTDGSTTFVPSIGTGVPALYRSTIKVINQEFTAEIAAAGRDIGSLAITAQLQSAIQKLLEILPGNIRIRIVDLQPGSLKVTFDIDTDGKQSEEDILRLLQEALNKGSLSGFQVSPDEFEFKRIRDMFSCAPGVGRIPSYLPTSGNNWANLMVNNAFPCDGFVVSWNYYRATSTGTGFIGVFRQVSDTEYSLVSKTEVPEASVGEQTLVLQTPILVRKGDFIGVFYDQASQGGVIAMATADDNAVAEAELFQNYYLSMYESDLPKGAPFSFNNFVSSENKATFAVQAEVSYANVPVATPPPRVTCSPDDWTCANGDCVPKNYRCDQQVDCYDGSDEENCPKLVCSSGEVLCGDGVQCVPQQFICNFVNDCGDNSDEKDCGPGPVRVDSYRDGADSTSFLLSWTRPQDGGTQIVSYVIKYRLVTVRSEATLDGDYVVDRALSDFSVTSLAPSANRYQLTSLQPGSYYQVEISAQNTNGASEPQAFVFRTANAGCPSGKWQCNNGGCVDLSSRCNGIPECSDDSDEHECESPVCNEGLLACPQPDGSTVCVEEAVGCAVTCRETEFQCLDGKSCISFLSLCDGRSDCGDLSDESNCECAEGEFQCVVGRKCISESRRCDQVADCEDSSDENNCPCPPGNFQCLNTDNQECVDSRLLCDDYPDCSDGSDEANCGCPDDKWQCNDGTCIPDQMRCDGRPQCEDLSDENGCVVTCSPGQYTCADGNCVEASMRCDGIPQCEDSSDEENCPCSDDMFQCADGNCVKGNMKCDGVPQCEDGSDEAGCPTEPPMCPTSDFKCQTTDRLECIDKRLMCDGYPDCSDSSDENDCPGCKRDEFTCASDEKCIPASSRCNGIIECNDRSDELGCVCTDEQFRCGDGICINISRRCDRRVDCLDQSDELACPCRSGEYQCVNGDCIPESRRCDGRLDCEDRSDEQGCPNTRRCPVGYYQCGTGHCLSENRRCDGYSDCPDGSDEQQCPLVCGEEELACPVDNKCISSDQICNRVYDCSDGSDELSCRRCSNDEFQCEADRSCISLAGKCNGVKECNDGSDEMNCPTLPPISVVVSPKNLRIRAGAEALLTCMAQGLPQGASIEWTRGLQGLPMQSAVEAGKLMIPVAKPMDSGDYKCRVTGVAGEFSDTARLEVVAIGPTPTPDTGKCGRDEAVCQNGQCIRREFRCDGEEDCTDGSDEPDDCKTNLCEPNEFQCPSGQCVMKIWRCDGENDCDDGFDESNCAEKEEDAPCGYDEFQCVSGNQCVPLAYQCDQEIDCLDRSDEIGCSPPIITVPPVAEIEVELGSTFTIICEAVGVPTPLIVWRLNWGNIPSGERVKVVSEDGRGMLVISDARYEDAGAYTCEAINNRGSIFAIPDALIIVRLIFTGGPAKEEINTTKIIVIGGSTDVELNVEQKSVLIGLFGNCPRNLELFCSGSFLFTNCSGSTEINLEFFGKEYVDLEIVRKIVLVQRRGDMLPELERDLVITYIGGLPPELKKDKNLKNVQILMGTTPETLQSRKVIKIGGRSRSKYHTEKQIIYVGIGRSCAGELKLERKNGKNILECVQRVKNILIGGNSEKREKEKVIDIGGVSNSSAIIYERNIIIQGKSPVRGSSSTLEVIKSGGVSKKSDAKDTKVIIFGSGTASNGIMGHIFEIFGSRHVNVSDADKYVEIAAGPACKSKINVKVIGSKVVCICQEKNVTMEYTGEGSTDIEISHETFIISGENAWSEYQKEDFIIMYIGGIPEHLKNTKTETFIVSGITSRRSQSDRKHGAEKVIDFGRENSQQHRRQRQIIMIGVSRHCEENLKASLTGEKNIIQCVKDMEKNTVVNGESVDDEDLYGQENTVESSTSYDRTVQNENVNEVIIAGKTSGTENEFLKEIVIQGTTHVENRENAITTPSIEGLIDKRNDKKMNQEISISGKYDNAGSEIVKMHNAGGMDDGVSHVEGKEVVTAGMVNRDQQYKMTSTFDEADIVNTAKIKDIVIEGGTNTQQLIEAFNEIEGGKRTDILNKQEKMMIDSDTNMEQDDKSKDLVNEKDIIVEQDRNGNIVEEKILLLRGTEKINVQQDEPIIDVGYDMSHCVHANLEIMSERNKVNVTCDNTQSVEVEYVGKNPVDIYISKALIELESDKTEANANNDDDVAMAIFVGRGIKREFSEKTTFEIIKNVDTNMETSVKKTVEFGGQTVNSERRVKAVVELGFTTECEGVFYKIEENGQKVILCRRFVGVDIFGGGPNMKTPEERIIKIIGKTPAKGTKNNFIEIVGQSPTMKDEMIVLSGQKIPQIPVSETVVFSGQSRNISAIQRTINRTVVIHGKKESMAPEIQTKINRTVVVLNKKESIAPVVQTKINRTVVVLGKKGSIAPVVQTKINRTVVVLGKKESIAPVIQRKINRTVVVLGKKESIAPVVQRKINKTVVVFGKKESIAPVIQRKINRTVVVLGKKESIAPVVQRKINKTVVVLGKKESIAPVIQRKINRTVVIHGKEEMTPPIIEKKTNKTIFISGTGPSHEKTKVEIKRINIGGVIKQIPAEKHTSLDPVEVDKFYLVGVKEDIKDEATMITETDVQVGKIKTATTPFLATNNLLTERYFMIEKAEYVNLNQVHQNIEVGLTEQCKGDFELITNSNQIIIQCKASGTGLNIEYIGGTETEIEIKTNVAVEPKFSLGRKFSKVLIQLGGLMSNKADLESSLKVIPLVRNPVAFPDTNQYVTIKGLAENVDDINLVQVVEIGIKRNCDSRNIQKYTNNEGTIVYCNKGSDEIQKGHLGELHHNTGPHRGDNAIDNVFAKEQDGNGSINEIQNAGIVGEYSKIINSIKDKQKLKYSISSESLINHDLHENNPFAFSKGNKGRVIPESELKLLTSNKIKDPEDNDGLGDNDALDYIGSLDEKDRNKAAIRGDTPIGGYQKDIKNTEAAVKTERLESNGKSGNLKSKSKCSDQDTASLDTVKNKLDMKVNTSVDINFGNGCKGRIKAIEVDGTVLVKCAFGGETFEINLVGLDRSKNIVDEKKDFHEIGFLNDDVSMAMQLTRDGGIIGDREVRWGKNITRREIYYASKKIMIKDLKEKSSKNYFDISADQGIHHVYRKYKEYGPTVYFLNTDETTSRRGDLLYGLEDLDNAPIVQSKYRHFDPLELAQDERSKISFNDEVSRQSYHDDVYPPSLHRQTRSAKVGKHWSKTLPVAPNPSQHIFDVDNSRKHGGPIYSINGWQGDVSVNSYNRYKNYDGFHRNVYEIRNKNSDITRENIDSITTNGYNKHFGKESHLRNNMFLKRHFGSPHGRSITSHQGNTGSRLPNSAIKSIGGKGPHGNFRGNGPHGNFRGKGAHGNHRGEGIYTLIGHRSFTKPDDLVSKNDKDNVLRSKYDISNHQYNFNNKLWHNRQVGKDKSNVAVRKRIMLTKSEDSNKLNRNVLHDANQRSKQSKSIDVTLDKIKGFIVSKRNRDTDSGSGLYALGTDHNISTVNLNNLSGIWPSSGHLSGMEFNNDIKTSVMIEARTNKARSEMDFSPKGGLHKGQKGPCDPPFFNFGATRSDECVRCFCFGQSVQCFSSDLQVSSIALANDMQLVRRTDDELTPVDKTYVNFRPTTREYQVVDMNRQLPQGRYYWNLPQEFRGERLTSYGGELKYTIFYEIQGRTQASTGDADVVISGNGITLYYRGRTLPSPGVPTSISVPLIESAWERTDGPRRGDTPISQYATREDFMTVLQNVEYVVIRGSYDRTQTTSRIGGIFMTTAVDYPTEFGQAVLVEECTCPTGYTGLSCQNCASGFTRIRAGGYLGQCVACNCNGHSNDCDPYTGQCINCLHNTEGPQCQLCNDGFYGDPRRGTPNDCQRCPCPLTDPANQFSSTCFFDTDNSVTCGNCPTGYEGRRCERCADGYVGDPMTPGSSCTKVKVDDYCDPRGSRNTQPNPTTGNCDCKENAVGDRCDRCEAQTFYLSSSYQLGCVRCFCMGVSKTCQSTSWNRAQVGATFSRDEAGFSLQDRNGKQLEDQRFITDTNNRELIHRLRSVPDSTLFWSIPSRFLGNKVSAYGGSLRFTLRYSSRQGGAVNSGEPLVRLSGNDIELVHRTRQDIEPNRPQAFNIMMYEQNWLRSDGNPATREHLLMALADLDYIFIRATYEDTQTDMGIRDVSLGIAEDRQTRQDRAYAVEQCVCPVGYRGLSCEDCDTGYTRTGGGLYLGMCEPCRCNGHSNECDPETGVCRNCQHNTGGDFCDSCAVGYYGDASRGTRNDCQKCPCPLTESPNQFSSTCMQDTDGQVTCTACPVGHTGRRCQSCIEGYTGNPLQVGDYCKINRGEICDCDTRGTVPNTQCDTNTQQCQCKPYSQGRRCARCREGHFYMESNNPQGCLTCFCSGITNQCTSSSYFRDSLRPQLGSDGRHNFVLMNRRMNNIISDGFVVDANRNQITFNQFEGVQQERESLFFQLPAKFRGDRVTSYGGYLRFTLEFTARNEGRMYRDVDLEIISSGQALRLYNLFEPPLQEGRTQTYEILLRESSFNDLRSNTAPTRETFMTILSNVEGILIRATYHQKMASVTLRDVSMDTAVPSATNLGGAPMVEDCRCPEGYTGLSCERCAEGYLHVSDGRGGLGRCVRCNCNGHASACDPDSGRCLDCQHNTEGDRCERCVTGFYGDATSGTPTDCYACPCPGTTASNQFSRTCYLAEDNKVTCDRCATGYAGRKCEICAEGYVGNPTRPGETCSPIDIVDRPEVKVGPTRVEETVGGTVVFTCEVRGNGPFNVVWSRLDSRQLPDRAYVSPRYDLTISDLTQDDSGRYVCTVTNAYGVTRGDVTLKVVFGESPLQVRIDTTRIEIEEGRTARFVCTAISNSREMTYILSWSKQGGQMPAKAKDQNGVLIIPNVQRSDAGNYVCMGSDMYTMDEEIAILIVSEAPEPAPVVRIEPRYQTVDEGSTVRFVCIASGTPTPKIEWYRGGNRAMNPEAIITGDGVLRIPRAKRDDESDYYCKASNEAGTTEVRTILYVSAVERPEITVIVRKSAIFVVAGQTARLECYSEDASGRVILFWSRRNGLPSGSSQDKGVLTIPNVQPSYAGSYVCTGTDTDTGRVNTAVTVLEVNVEQETVAPTVKVEPEKLTIAMGTTGTLRCSATGTPTPTVTWIKSREELAPNHQVNGNLLRITAATMADRGIYVCRAENEAGSDQDWTVVEVERRMRPKIDLYPNTTQKISVGSSALFQCRVMDGDPPPAVTWSRVGGLAMSEKIETMDNGVIMFKQVTQEEQGSYICTASNDMGVITATATLIVEGPPTITIQPSKIIYAIIGQRVTLECTAEGSPTPVVYWVQPNQPRRGDIEVAAGALDYPTGDGSAVLNIPGVERGDQGYYKCVASNSGGRTEESVQLIVRDGESAGVTISGPGTLSVVEGQGVELVCTASAIRNPVIRWRRVEGALPPGHSVSNGILRLPRFRSEYAGEYICTTTTRQTTYEASVIIIVTVAPRLTISPQRVTTRAGDVVQLRCTASGSGPFNIEWSREDGQMNPTATENRGVLEIRQVTAADAGRYRCVVESSAGSNEGYAIVEVEVPPAVVVGRRDVYSRTSSVAELRCDVTGKPVPTIRWQKETGDLPAQHRIQNGVLTIYNVDREDAGRYICTASSTAGSARDYAVLHVDEGADIDNTNGGNVDTQVVNVGDRVSMECIVTGTPLPTITWSRDDGPMPVDVILGDGILIIPQAKIEDAGTYTCLAVNEAGSISSKVILYVRVNASQLSNGSQPLVNAASATSAALGGSVSLVCDASGYPSPDITWYRKDGNMPEDYTIVDGDLKINRVRPEDAGTYVCHAENQYGKTDTPVDLNVGALVPYFNQDPKSYMVYEPLKDVYLDFDILLSLKPESTEGMVLYNGQFEDGGGDFVCFGINEGYPEFRFDVGSGPAVIRGNKTLGLNKWHTIKLTRDKKKGSMQVDDEPTYTGESPGYFTGLDLEQNMYLGSVPNFDNIPRVAGFRDGFVGSISEMKLKGISVNLGADALEIVGVESYNACKHSPCSNRGTCIPANVRMGFTCMCPQGFRGSRCEDIGEQCYEGACGPRGRCYNLEGRTGFRCVCPLGKTGPGCLVDVSIINPFFNRSSFISYPAAENALFSLVIYLEFKPRSLSDGIILYEGNSRDGSGDFMAIVQKDGYLEFRFDTGSGPAIVRSRNPLRLNEWTRVTATRTNSKGTLVVNDDEPVTEKSWGYQNDQGYKAAESRYYNYYNHKFKRFRRGASPGSTVGLNLKLPMYLGGPDPTYTVAANAGATVGFIGCVAELQVNDRKVDLLNDAIESHHIVDCGERRLCERNPCKNGAICEDLPGPDFRCLCPSSHQGKTCEVEINICLTNSPCRNGAPCSITDEGYRCDCTLGFSGDNCENAISLDARMKFEGDGFVEFTRYLLPHNNTQERQVVSFSMATTQADGLILWQGEPGGKPLRGGDHFSIGLVGGYLEFSYEMGSGAAVILSRKRVDDGQKHTVSVERLGRTGSLTVDTDETVYGDSQGFLQMLNADGNIYIGGVSTVGLMTDGKYSENFVGCIENINIHGKGPLESRDAIQGFNVQRCSP